ncbi:MAG: cell envelope integrity protein CreD [Candidatus Methylacidiphilales bacterium]
MKEKIGQFIKVAVIGIIALILLIPLGMISNMVSERSEYQMEAMRGVADSWADKQHVIGPVLVIPYEVVQNVVEWNEKKRVETTREVRETRYLQLPAAEVNAVVDLQTEMRSKGIYSFPVYRSETRLAGRFQLKGIQEVLKDSNASLKGSPKLLIGLGDPRGIASAPTLVWQGKELNFEPGTPGGFFQTGVHAVLPEVTAAMEGQNVEFAVNMDLQGMAAYQMMPTARSSRLDMSSNWPHPSFSGSFPALTREISDAGFTATWQMSHFATNLESHFTGHKARSFNDLESLAVGVRLFHPVDVYTVTQRALKYGFLFVALTFAAFFFFEMIRDLRIHPIQYGLVGIALALFFLILLSLSEHILFGWAYFIASSACILLLVFYLASVLAGWKRAMGFGAALTLLYGTLFILLQLQDFALLVGSGILFVVLAGIMLGTRHLNWYQLGDHKAEQPPQLPDTIEPKRN